MKKTQFFSLCCIAIYCASFQTIKAQTIKVWPGTTVGSGVTYGADVKLTLFRITNNDAVNKTFKTLGLDMVRVPVIAHWGTTDNKYTTIKNYVANVKANSMNVFASVANTNGKFKTNGDLDDAHGAAKFPSWMKCNNTCTTSEKGLYDVNLTKYKKYLQDVVNNKITNTSWVGPWNEDNASPNDYSKLDWGKSIIGSELWSLASSDTEMKEVKSVIDIGGAHHYDNGSNLQVAYTDWKNFVKEGGSWFTESTLFAQSTAAGIAHMLPAMSAGIKKIIIYQTVPRVVTTSGGKATSYDAVNELIKNSKGKGSALQVEVNNKNYVASAFKSSGQLILHVCNISTATGTIFINLQGYKVSTSGANVAKFGGTEAAVSFANNGQQVKVKLSGNTYARITLSSLATVSSALVSNDIQTTDKLVVFPNPTNQPLINVQLPQETTGKINTTVIDLMGRIVHSQTFEGSSSFDLSFGSNLPRGMYKIIVQTNNKTYTQPLVLN